MKKSVLVLLTVLSVTVFICGCNKENNESTLNGSSKVNSGDTDISEIIEEAVPSKPDYSAFTGNYQDLTSKRAVAEVTENEDMESCRIVVSWGNSAFETVQWTMNGKWADEKLSYTDCKKDIITTDKDGKNTYTTEYENGKGYFTFDGVTGNLSWVGAEEENCKACVFEKYNY